MASLNPALTVGEQIAETLTLHRGLRGRRARRPRARAAAPGAHQRPRAPRARLPAPDERRHPPARGRRHRHLLPAEPAHRRRADDLARRDDPGPVPAPPEGHPARDQSGAGLRHARPRHRGQAVRPRRRHVRGADRGDGDDARDLQPAAASVHHRPAELPALAPPRARAADRDRGPAARSRRRPARLRASHPAVALAEARLPRDAARRWRPPAPNTWSRACAPGRRRRSTRAPDPGRRRCATSVAARRRRTATSSSRPATSPSTSRSRAARS